MTTTTTTKKNKASFESVMAEPRTHTVPKHFYIGAVTLLCRVHARMEAEQREQFDAAEGDPLSHVASDFNQCVATLQMVRNGDGDTWMVTANADEIPAPEGRAS